MISAKTGRPETMEGFCEGDPTMRVGVDLPFFVGSGTKNASVVYFGFGPGCGLGSRIDSAQEEDAAIEAQDTLSQADEALVMG
jgi:hypothetical protein